MITVIIPSITTLLQASQLATAAHLHLIIRNGKRALASRTKGMGKGRRRHTSSKSSQRGAAMRNRVLYLDPTKTARALDHLKRDAMRLKRFFTDRVKFASDYIGYRRQGKSHETAVTNARNAF